MDNDFKFDCDSHGIDGLNLSFLDSGGKKTPLHFYHANGFPVSVYLPFMERLTNDFRVIGMGQRGQDSQTTGSTSWQSSATDLIDFIEKRVKLPIVGVGHSIGAVATMFAAARRPDLFKKIILIDPVMLPYRYIAYMAFIRIIGQKNAFILAKRARGRRNHWESRQDAYDYFKGKALFKNFKEEFLRSYITYGLKESEKGGVELVCPPEAEARVFENYPLYSWFWPRKLKTKTLLLRAEFSDVMFMPEQKRFIKQCKNSQAIVIKNSGHLIPMEKPDEVVNHIKDFVFQ
ncbi:MAG: alpha/beta hydrolase [Desulforegulaceae bacterium]|nr:alpha/beta hydrolase [Desulforegulaceae bacterium]